MCVCVCVEGPVLVQDVREWLPRHGCRHLRGWQGKENHELGRCLCVCCYTHSVPSWSRIELPFLVVQRPEAALV